MSVFEDLIDELKSENLLEETVIDPAQPATAVLDSQRGSDVDSADVRQLSTDDGSNPDVGLPQISEPVNEREFFRKRAMEEVSSLQMVEHVLSSVEKAQMNKVPAAFDDLKAKQALHRFMQVSENVRSPEHAETEFALRHETEAWNFALYERDQSISVANVRRFCEESRPVLSSQALIALARFYRNSPYSEEVRGKFDYVVTRLFSREVGGELREKLFEITDMIGHLNTLYANWSSIVLFTNEEDQLEVSLTLARFEEFIDEVRHASSFGELLRSEFFNRLRAYKEELAELFFVPEVVAAALRCNLAVGNRYVELIGLERKKFSTEKIEEKYGADHDEIVSHVAGKTLSVAEIARIEPDDESLEPETRPDAPAPTVSKKQPVEKHARNSTPAFDLFGVNRWLIAVCILSIALSAGVYAWAEKFAAGNENSATVAAPVKVDDPELLKYIKSSRAGADTFYAVAKPEYQALDEKEKKGLLEKLHAFAAAQGLPKVNLLNSKGQSVAYASKNRLELINE